MISRKSFIVFSALAVMALLLGACAPAAAPAATATKPAAAQPAATQPAKSQAQGTAAPATPAGTPKPTQNPKYGGTLAIFSWAALSHYDIHQNSDSGGVLPFQHAYNNIVQYDPVQPAKIVGDLADSWDVSDGGKVYTFHLHKGVKFHDGKPFSSADAKASLDRMYNPPKGVIVPKVGELMKAIKQVDAPDPDTVKVTLKDVSASFMPGLATVWCAIFPKHILDAKGDMKRDIIGTGPFKFKADIPDSSFELVKNSDYFKPGKPYLDGIKYFIIKDAATRFATFRTKQVQLTSPTHGFLPSQLDAVKREMPDVTVAQFEGASFIGFYFPTNKAPWNDINVRKALSLAQDRQEAVKVVEEGYGTVAGPMPPGPWALSQDEVLKVPGYRQPKDEDRAEAKRLLAAAGQSDLKFNMVYRTGSVYEREAEFFKDQMSKIGVTANIKPLEQTVLYDQLYKGELEAAEMKLAWSLYDPDDVLLQYYRSGALRNFAGFSDPEVDKLIDEQAKTIDEARRKEVVLNLQRKIMENVPFVQSHWVNSIMGWRPEVKNFVRPLSQYTYWRLEDAWLDR